MASVNVSSLVLVTSLTATSLLAACSDGETPDTGSGGGVSSGGTTGGSSSGGMNSGGTSSGGDNSGSGGGDSSVPADTSQTGIEAFLEAESYREEPWIGDAQPRESEDGSNPHGDVRAFLNETAVSSIEAGDNVLGAGAGSLDSGNSTDSMAVKEFYDQEGTLTGKAVMLRMAETGEGTDWLYYCTSTNGTCTSSGEDSEDFYGQGIGECHTCHRGVFYSPMASDGPTN